MYLNIRKNDLKRKKVIKSLNFKLILPRIPNLKKLSQNGIDFIKFFMIISIF